MNKKILTVAISSLLFSACSISNIQPQKNNVSDSEEKLKASAKIVKPAIIPKIKRMIEFKSKEELVINHPTTIQSPIQQVHKPKVDSPPLPVKEISNSSRMKKGETIYTADGKIYFFNDTYAYIKEGSDKYTKYNWEISENSSCEGIRNCSISEIIRLEEGDVKEIKTIYEGESESSSRKERELRKIEKELSALLKLYSK